jgi:hypothetical protein
MMRQGIYDQDSPISFNQSPIQIGQIILIRSLKLHALHYPRLLQRDVIPSLLI